MSFVCNEFTEYVQQCETRLLFPSFCGVVCNPEDELAWVHCSDGLVAEPMIAQGVSACKVLN